MRSFSFAAAVLVPLSSLVNLSLAAAVRRDSYEVTELTARDEFQTTSSNKNSDLVCFYLTTSPNWTGEAENLCQVPGTCSADLPSRLSANVSSAGPDPNVACFLYSARDCGGTRSAPIVNPGYADLSDIGFDKKAQSWQCWRLCGEGSSSAVVSSTSTGRAGRISTTMTRLSVDSSKAEARATSISKTISAASASASSSQSVQKAAAAAGEVSITTTLSGPQPTATMGATPSTTSSSTSSSTTTPSVIRTTLSIVSLSPSSSSPSSPATSSTTSTLSASTSGPLANAPTPFPPGGTSVESTSTTSTPSTTTFSPPSLPTPAGVGMLTTDSVETHTFADGSTTVFTTAVVEPISSTPTPIQTETVGS